MKTYVIYLDENPSNWVKVLADEVLLKDGCLMFHLGGDLAYIQAAGTWNRVLLSEEQP